MYFVMAFGIKVSKGISNVTIRPLEVYLGSQGR